MKKRVLALFMAVSLASASFPMTAWATEIDVIPQQEESGVVEEPETTEETEKTEAPEEKSEVSEEQDATEQPETVEATEQPETTEETEVVEEPEEMCIRDREWMGKALEKWITFRFLSRMR